MLNINNLGYSHPDKQVLFTNLSASITQQNKIALVGHNGIGKSILLKIIAGLMKPTEGTINTVSKAFYIPQNFGQFDNSTIEEALGIDMKLYALNSILKGSFKNEDFELLGDDWNIEEKIVEAFSFWKLPKTILYKKLKELSGGQKTKIYLASLLIHEPSLILLDEPTNHLDQSSRKLLLNYIRQSKATFLIVSHDRSLLEEMDEIWELTNKGIQKYGGNYSFYLEQKSILNDSLQQHIKQKEIEIRKATLIQKESIDRQKKLNSRAKIKNIKGGVPKIMLNTWRNSGEQTASKIKDIHVEKQKQLNLQLDAMKDQLIFRDGMKLHLDNSKLHFGKILVLAKNLNYTYDYNKIWNKDLNFEIRAGERYKITGDNGTGKSTLLNLICKKIITNSGSLQLEYNSHIYIDQEYSIINDNLSIFEQASRYNHRNLQQHEINIYLTRFLFYKNDWDKQCSSLSGGEKIRLILCCINIQNVSPDLIIMDEPTNNLDLQNIDILTHAIKSYQGTILIVSHDQKFLEDLSIYKEINLI